MPSSDDFTFFDWLKSTLSPQDHTTKKQQEPITQRNKKYEEQLHKARSDTHYIDILLEELRAEARTMQSKNEATGDDL